MGKRHLPPLETGRVRLRLLEERDLPQTLAWRNQDHIRRWFFSSERLTPAQHAGWFAGYRQRDDDFVFIIEELPSPRPAARVPRRGAGGEVGLQSVAAKSGHISPTAPHPGPLPEGEGDLARPVGQVAIYHVDWPRARAEFGRLMIGEADATGRGLAREATAAVVALAFHQLGLQEVYLEVIPGNLRAIKLYEACGFEVAGSAEQAVRMSKTA